MALQITLLSALSLLSLVVAQPLQRPYLSLPPHGAVRSPPPGGYAPPDAVEVATRDFIRRYKEAAALSAAAPDIDVYTPPPRQSYQPRPSLQPAVRAQVPRPTGSAPVQVSYTPEVAAARAAFQQVYQAQAKLAAESPENPDTYSAQRRPQQHQQQQFSAPRQAQRPYSAPVQHQQPSRQQVQTRLVFDENGKVVGQAYSQDVAAARQEHMEQYHKIAALLASLS